MIKKYQGDNLNEVKAHYFGQASVNLVLTQKDAVAPESIKLPKQVVSVKLY